MIIVVAVLVPQNNFQLIVLDISYLYFRYLIENCIYFIITVHLFLLYTSNLFYNLLTFRLADPSCTEGFQRRANEKPIYMV